MVLMRYPRLIAHMICESLGYFTPMCAANAIIRYLEGDTFPCEWYSHRCNCRGRGYFHKETLLDIGRETIASSFARRKHHTGYMASYQHAHALVAAELKREGCTSGMLASWF
jgi:hypothetical protein